MTFLALIFSSSNSSREFFLFAF